MTAPTIEDVMKMVDVAAEAWADFILNGKSDYEDANRELRAAILAYAAAQVRERTEECIFMCEEMAATIGILIAHEIRAKFLADEPGDTLDDQIDKAKADRATWPQWLDPDFRDRSAVPPKPGDGREDG